MLLKRPFGVRVTNGCEIVWKRSGMKIIWRNPNRIAQNPVSIVSTGSLEEPGHVQRFFRSSSGLGILGTKFELWVNCKKPPNRGMERSISSPRLEADERSPWALFAKPALQPFSWP